MSSPYQCKQQPCRCSCGSCPKKIRGKFGLAWVVETPDCKREPSGWQVEFFDTPSRVIQKCQNMVEWVNAPPVMCTCAMQEEDDCSSESHYCSHCCAETLKDNCGNSRHCQNHSSPNHNCCCSCHKQRTSRSEELPVKDQSKVDRGSSPISSPVPSQKSDNSIHSLKPIDREVEPSVNQEANEASLPIEDGDKKLARSRTSARRRSIRKSNA